MRRALPRQESQEPRPWCNSESFTFPSNPVDWTDAGSICKMSLQAEEAGLRGEQEKRGGRELVPRRRNTPGPSCLGGRLVSRVTLLQGGPVEVPGTRCAGGQQNPCSAASPVPPPTLLRHSLLDNRFRHHDLHPLPEATLTSLLRLSAGFTSSLPDTSQPNSQTCFCQDLPCLPGGPVQWAFPSAVFDAADTPSLPCWDL